MNDVPKVVIMAGGTGGHVVPAIAVAKQLQALGVEVLMLGTCHGIEARLVPEAGLSLAFLEMKALRGKGIVNALKTPFRVLKAVGQARKLFREFKPTSVLGMGGYVCGPGALAAKLLGCRLVIHEQNAIAGLTNKLSGYFADAICEGFSGAFPSSEKVRVTGNPVREAIRAARESQSLSMPDFASRKMRVLVVGGSLGAKVFNEKLPALFARCQASLEIDHQGGARTVKLAEVNYQQYPSLQVNVREYISDMVDAYANADLVICRAGAMTVAEVACIGVPAIFIPFPYAVDDHQTANAQFLVSKGAALLLPEKQLESTQLVDLLDDLYQNPDKLLQMREHGREIPCTDAALQVAKICLES